MPILSVSSIQKLQSDWLLQYSEIRNIFKKVSKDQLDRISEELKEETKNYLAFFEDQITSCHEFSQRFLLKIIPFLYDDDRDETKEKELQSAFDSIVEIVSSSLTLYKEVILHCHVDLSIARIKKQKKTVQNFIREVKSLGCTTVLSKICVYTAKAVIPVKAAMMIGFLFTGYGIILLLAGVVIGGIWVGDQIKTDLNRRQRNKNKMIEMQHQLLAFEKMWQTAGARLDSKSLSFIKKTLEEDQKRFHEIQIQIYPEIKLRMKDKDCSICCETLLGKSLSRPDSCFHIFHSTCILSWTKQQENTSPTCPLCRANYSNVTPVT
jgi:hypothetical protein